MRVERSNLLYELNLYQLGLTALHALEPPSSPRQEVIINTSTVTVLKHLLQVGMKEGRDPSIRFLLRSVSLLWRSPPHLLCPPFVVTGWEVNSNLPGWNDNTNQRL